MATARCPTCNRQFDVQLTEAMPFCSERCRQIDLGRWLDEQNSITVLKSPDDLEDDGLEDDGAGDID